MAGIRKRNSNLQIGQNIKKIIYVLIAAVAVIAALLLFSLNSSHDAVIMTVNNEHVTKEEFQKEMEELKSIVFAYFADKYDVSGMKHFWTDNFDGEVPLDFLKSKAMDKIKETRVKQILAKQNGIESYLDYASFKKKLEYENKRRKEAKRKNEPIYGPVQYQEREYYWYVMGNMVEELKKKLANSTLAVSEADLKKYYEENIEQYKKQDSAGIKSSGYKKFDEVQGQIRNRIAGRKFDNLIADMIKNAYVVINIKEYDKLQMN